MSPVPADYVDVAERKREFVERYPEGVLQSWLRPYIEQVGDRSYIVYAAAAYRTPDDPRPGIGWAWEPVPGPTPFTYDSELQNAETSAWGRAILALGFETKKIASAEEVRNRSAGEPSAPTRAAAPQLSSAASPAGFPLPGSWEAVQDAMTPYGQLTVDDFNAFGAQARAHQFPESDEIEPKDATKLRMQAAMAAKFIRDECPMDAFPGPNRDLMRRAWNAALGVELEGPPWRMSVEEMDREPRA